MIPIPQANSPGALPWWWEIVRTLLPGVFALVGAAGGGIFALRRYKGERAIDRRLEWHERMCRALYKLRWHIQVALGLYEQGHREAAAKELRIAYDLADDFTAISTERELYATEKGFVALNTFVDVLNRLQAAGADAKYLEWPLQLRQALHDIALQSAMTARDLAREFRADLGWPRLPDRVPSPFADQPNFPKVGSESPTAGESHT